MACFVSLNFALWELGFGSDALTAAFALPCSSARVLNC
jgi:hypothetical protein